MSKDLKRCIKCKRPIREENKRGYCCGCAANQLRIERKKRFCSICEEKCSGNMNMELRKGSKTTFCTYHFNRLNRLNSMKDIRIEVKRLKSI